MNSSPPAFISQVPASAPPEETKLPRRIVVAATFTANALRQPVAFWMKQLQISYGIEFAPYNQVFQQLLSAQSVLSRNMGTNVVLLRLEDLQAAEEPRAARSTMAAQLDNLRRNVGELASALVLAADRSLARWLIFICPPLPGLG